MSDDIYSEFVRIASRPAWLDQAACRGCDPELFFPTRGEDSDGAKAICASCPVQAECLQFAIDNVESFGIWGGMSARGRRKVRSKMRYGDRTDQHCH